MKITEKDIASLTLHTLEILAACQLEREVMIQAPKTREAIAALLDYIADQIDDE
jgi:hypothetical protein